MGFFSKLTAYWNAFQQSGAEPYLTPPVPYTINTSPRARYIPTDRSTLQAILTRIAVDAAAVDLIHAKLDDQGRFLEQMDTDLNNALTLSPNIDQTPQDFKNDLFLTLLEEGQAVIVPVSATKGLFGELVDIMEFRVGVPVAYYRDYLKVNLFNHETGQRQDIVILKRDCAIVTNPFASVMNDKNSTLSRLAEKIRLLDQIDAHAGSGRLDLIIQLPYVVKSEAKRESAERRRTELETQLMDSKFGIAYSDSTEKITQLNRPVVNNLVEQIDGLFKKLYTELGLTPEIMNGTAEPDAMINYYSRVVYPIVENAVQAMQKVFIGRRRTADKERLFYVRSKLTMVPFAELGKLVDVTMRNEVTTANDWRGWLGLPPSTEPKADMLVNSNMPQQDMTDQPPGGSSLIDELTRSSQNGT
jgi:hypothetical protein